MFSPKRRLPSAPSTRKRSFRPRLEELENRLAPAGLLTLTIPKTIVPTQPPSGGPASAGPALTSFSAASGALSITGSGAAVQVAATADGGLNVTVNGQLLSSDPSSPNYYPALAGAVESAVHNITLTGGGSVDALTLDNLSGSNLTIQSDGYATLGAVAESGQLTATAPRMTIDGAVSAAVLSLNSPGLLFVEGDGSLAAPSITVTADSYVSTGQVRADGAQGGAVSVTAVDYLNAGVVSASGSAGAGGSVTVNFTDSYIDVQAAVTAAAGVGGAGGQISIDGGTTGRLFSSGTFTATGTTGGDIDLFGNSIALIAATADADGSAGAGGRIRVGGDYQGNNPAVPNAQTVVVSNAATLSADAGGMGAGGRIIVWSQSTTTFAGTLSAQPAGGAAGGFLEVSSHGQLNYGGTANAGVGGQLLLDPQFLTVAAAAPFSQYSLVNPATSGSFGTSELVLSNGNIVVTDPGVSNNSGAVYLFNGQTGALISALKGGLANDSFAPTLQQLSSGNYLVIAPTWASGVGAVTWGSGTTGVSGLVSAFNSLVGSFNTDAVGSQVYILPTNGNYLVNSPAWDEDTGAVTWGSQLAGVKGTISDTNSLIGDASGDVIGSNTVDPNTGLFTDTGDGIFMLGTTGNYVVDSPSWNGATGAVTWGKGTTGVVGDVSQTNSLVGANSGDEIGYAGGFAPGVAVLNGTGLNAGDYVVESPAWNIFVGAATWGSGSTGVVGVVSAANSLVGSTSGDEVALLGVTALTNGNYVVSSPDWNGGLGAATFGNGRTGVIGTISGPARRSNGNSLVGATAGDLVGAFNVNLGANTAENGVIALSDGNYVVDSSSFNFSAGAVTWGSGFLGVDGTVSGGGAGANSLVGQNSGDQIGLGGITVLGNGHYVIDSPDWSGSTGAVTWETGGRAVTGTFTGLASLTGTNAGDLVGGGGVTRLTGTNNYVVDSPAWSGNTGAVTWENGSLPITGTTVSALNSLVGANSGDAVGSIPSTSTSTPIVVLPNGNYLVFSYSFGGGVGAVTEGTPTTALAGVVSSTNSLVGGTGDRVVGDGTGDHVGFDQINDVTDFANLSGGAVVVLSPNWNGGKGAVTEAISSNLLTGVVSGNNSLIGDQSGDEVGEGGVTVNPANGNYVVLSPQWNNNTGAATWMNGAGPATGKVSATITTLFGSSAGDQVGSDGAVALPDGNFVVLSGAWNKNTGAATWINGATGGTMDGANRIDAQNSIEGTATQTSPSINGAAGPTTVSSSFLAAFPQDNTVQIGVTDPNQIVYALAQGQTLTVNPNFLTQTLDTGTSITLQANDDITINSPIVESGTTPGNLTLEAGRSIFLNATINTDGQAANWQTQTSGTVNPLNGVWGTGSSDVFAVGAGGTILHSTNDGGSWTAQPSKTFQTLNGVWGSDSSNIFAVGANGTILQSLNDGVSWTALPSGTAQNLTAVWGSSVFDIFAVGANGTILHSTNDGASWTTVLSGTAQNLTGVWGSSATDIFVVGANGVILHSGNDGATWSPQSSGSVQNLTGVWGTSSSDVFAVGAGGVILHSANDGFTWQPQASGTLQALAGVFGSSSSDVFAVGANNTILHSANDGTLWTGQVSSSTQSLAGVWESGPNDVFSVGANGTILHFSTTGNLTLIANDSQADGVVDAERDPGNAVIKEKAGVTLNAGGAILSIDLQNGTDKTNNGQGVLTLLGATATPTTISAATQLGVTVNGTTPGDGTAAGTYTQTNVNGPLTLNGSLVVSKLASVSAPVGTVFTIIQASGGVSGTFAGLPQNAAVFASDGTAMTISYTANGGDAVTLTVDGTTSTAVTSSANPATPGSLVTFTVTVTNTSGSGAAPSGTVEMFDGVKDIGPATLVASSGAVTTYTFSTSTLALGFHTISADFTATPGSALISSSGSMQEQIAFVTSLNLTSNDNPAVFGEQVVLKATVTNIGGGPAPTGSVEFFDGAVDLGAGAASIGVGSTTVWTFTSSTLQVGIHPITAKYTPTSSLLPSSGSLTETVDAATPVVVLRTDGSLIQESATGGFQTLSPAGTILSVSNVIDGNGRNYVYAITTAGRTLWQYAATLGWSELSPGSFQQISAASNRAGDPVVFGVVTGGSLWENGSQFPGNNWSMLSGPGTIQSISAVADSAGNDVVFAITTAGNNLWEHSPALPGNGWTQLSAGNFTQISAGRNGAGQAVLYGIVSGGALYEYNPAFLGSWQLLSGPGTIVSVSAAGPDEVFATTTLGNNLWEHKLSGWSPIAFGNFSSISATQTTTGNDAVYGVLADSELWEYDPFFAGTGWQQLLPSNAAAAGAPQIR